jgi:hypothetical protein
LWVVGGKERKVRGEVGKNVSLSKTGKVYFE